MLTAIKTVIKKEVEKLVMPQVSEAEMALAPMNPVMEEIMRNSENPPEIGSLVTGTVIGRDKMALYVDVPPFGTGIIFGREYLIARDIIKEINEGDEVTAKVVLPEGERGYMELSLKEAKQAIIWSEAKKYIDNKEPLNLIVKEANKGGLILEWQGLDGFMPASQLKAEHYPKVPDGDKDKILVELLKFVGQPLEVFVIAADPKEGKLIFSEKIVGNQVKKDIIERYALGDTVEGQVTGAVDFGIFVKIEDGLEGLIHISEIDWSLVENPKGIYKVGEVVKAKIIEVKDNKISLSLKALKKNPWEDAGKKYNKGDAVKGVVIKHNKHGALVSLEEGVAGLVHVSEFTNEDLLRKSLELGKTYPFTINFFDAKNQKMTLSPNVPTAVKKA